jgi:hypothetical protein
MFRNLLIIKNGLEILLRTLAYIWGSFISISTIAKFYTIKTDSFSFNLRVLDAYSKHTAEEMTVYFYLHTLSFLVSIFILVGTRKFSVLFNEWDKF